MANINLLPWREALREERKRQFLSVLLGILILGVLVGFSADRFIQGRIDHQQARNDYIQAGIRELDQKVAEIRRLKEQKQDMLDRMEVIKNLQNSRPEYVRLFDEFVRVLADGAYVTNLVARGNRLSIEGRAQANARISSYMRNLHDSAKFNSPNLSKVEANRELGDQGSDFEMTVQVIPRSFDSEPVGAVEEAGAAADGGAQ